MAKKQTQTTEVTESPKAKYDRLMYEISSGWDAMKTELKKVLIALKEIRDDKLYKTVDAIDDWEVWLQTKSPIKKGDVTLYLGMIDRFGVKGVELVQKDKGLSRKIVNDDTIKKIIINEESPQLDFKFETEDGTIAYSDYKKALKKPNTVVVNPDYNFQISKGVSNLKFDILQMLLKIKECSDLKLENVENLHLVLKSYTQLLEKNFPYLKGRDIEIATDLPTIGETKQIEVLPAEDSDETEDQF